MAKTKLNWDDVGSAAGYRIFYRREDTGVEEFVDIPPSHHPMELLAQFPVPPGFIYFFRVAAVAASGQIGLESEELRYEAPLPAPPNLRLE